MQGIQDQLGAVCSNPQELLCWQLPLNSLVFFFLVFPAKPPARWPHLKVHLRLPGAAHLAAVSGLCLGFFFFAKKNYSWL